MSRLKVRSFTDDSGGEDLINFSGLDKNPNFKGGDEGVDEGADEGVDDGDKGDGTQDLGVDNTDKGSTNKNDDQPDNNQDDDKGQTTDKVDDKSDKSSLKPNIPEERELKEEEVFKYLSEKLGREIKSQDDLTIKEQVENPLESDPFMKEIYEWRKKTGGTRPIEDWVRYQRDFSKVDDLEVAREFLRLEYPTLDESEISLELKKFIPEEEDFDDEAAMKKLNLKKYALKGRKALEELKSNLGQPNEISYPREIQEKVKYAENVYAKIQENQKATEDYAKSIEKQASAVEKIKLNIAEGVSLDYSVDPEFRKSIPKIVQSPPNWKNEDGTWNHRAVVEDAIKIQKFEEMMKIAYEQGLNVGKDENIKSLKNSTLDKKTETNVDGGSKGAIVEDEEKLFGGKSLKVRFK